MAKEKHWMFNWRRFVSIFGGVVVFVTAYALILPALTMTKTEQVLECPAEVHTHSVECYDSEGYLACGKADFVVHVHEAGCFDESGNLTCELSQIVEHQHSEACYSETQSLICSDEEHVHTEDCMVDGELICEQEEHQHTESCYEMTREMACCQEEIILHTHQDECYAGDLLICGQMEVRQHQHADGCFMTVKVKEEAEVEETVPEGTVETKVTEIPAAETTEIPEVVENSEEIKEVQIESETTETAEVGQQQETAAVGEASTEEVTAVVAEENSVDEQTPQRIVTRTYTGRDFAVTVQTTEAAMIPINSTLAVNEIMPGTEEYTYYYQHTISNLMASGEQQVVFARFFDICFMLDGAEVEPQAPVDVVIAYQNRVDVPEGDPGVVHFEGNGAVQNVDLGNASASAAEEAFALSCYSEENAFAFAADSFSVWGTTVVRTYESGKTTAECANRSIVSELKNGEIIYTTKITPDHTSDTYTISTRSNAEPGEKIPVVGANGIDGISLASKELKVTKNGVEVSSAELDGKLYCEVGDTFVQVEYLSIDKNVLVPFDKEGKQMSGTIYLVHDEEQHEITLGVKNLSVVEDTEKLSAGETGSDAIIWYDVIGTNGAQYVEDAYTVSFKGVEGNLFQLSRYFAGDTFYYLENASGANANDKGFIENEGTQKLKPCRFVKIVKNGDQYELQPCDDNGNAATNATLYAITDTQYQFAFYVNSMVKEHGEDDGHAYFWYGTQFYVGSGETSGTMYHLNDAKFAGSSVDFSNYNYQSTSINQLTYYLIGRVGESFIASEASSEPIKPGDAPVDPLTAVLYAATGDETRMVYNNNQNQAWKEHGWHTPFTNMGDHASDGGGRNTKYSIRDYFVLDSSWDKAMNFIITGQENGIPILNVQKYDDPVLYPLTDSYSMNPATGRQSQPARERRTMVGYNQGKETAIQLVYARPGILARMVYAKDTSNEYEMGMDHVQLRVDANVVIEMNGIKYQGSFLFMSGKVSPYAWDDGNWHDMSQKYSTSKNYVSDANLNTGRKWYDLGVDNAQESKMFNIQRNKHYAWNGREWDPGVINIAIQYNLAGVLKPILSDGKVDTDPSHWILYMDKMPSRDSYMTSGKHDPIADNVITTMTTALNGGAQLQPEFVYSLVLDQDMLEQATYACPNTKGYDVILDVNAAFTNAFEQQQKIVFTKFWDDLGYEMFRPDAVTVMVERQDKATGVWSDFQLITFTGVMNEMQWVASYTFKSGEADSTKWDYRIKENSEKFIWYGDRANDLHCQYDVSYATDGLSLTNKVVMPKVAVEGYKLWYNSDGSTMAEDEIPASITLNLYQSKKSGELGNLLNSCIVTEGTQKDWFWKFGDMDKYFVGDDGKLREYIYTVAEVKAVDDDGYEVLHEYNGSVLGGHLVEGQWTLVEAEKLIEGDGNTFVFVNRRKPVISFQKIDPKGTPLQGAKFLLTEENNPNGLSIEFVSDASGYLVRKDSSDPTRSIELDRDKVFVLTETQAPAGYIKLSDPIYIRYDSQTNTWICTFKDTSLTTKKLDADHSDLVTLQVENQGVRLPETGGSGTRAITAAGIMLITFSLIAIVWMGRKKKRCE